MTDEDQQESNSDPDQTNPDAAGGTEASNETRKTEVPSSRFAGPLTVFVDQLRATASCTPLLRSALGVLLSAQQAKYDAFVKKYTVRENDDDDSGFHVAYSHWHIYSRITQQRNEFAMACHSLPNTALVSMVSTFDVLVGALIRAVLLERPEILDSLEKPITYKKLVELGDLAAVRDHVIEKQVESVLRENHAYHFKWLEDRLGIPLRKGLDSWPNFIELTERRNLLVHGDAVVSAHYIEQCQQHGAPIPPDAEIGKQLSTDSKYFGQCRDVLLELGIKLTQVVWRKLRPQDLEIAEGALIDTTFNLLKAGYNRAAATALEFFVEERKWTSEHRHLICRINLAQALKWSRQNDKMTRVLVNCPLEILSPKFQLAIAVLKDDFEQAASLMSKLGSEDFQKEDYISWPLFKKFRRSPEFKAAFETVYEQPFDEFQAAADDVDQELEAVATSILEENLGRPPKPPETSAEAQ